MVQKVARQVEAVFCPGVHSYVAADGLTCPWPHCSHQGGGCPLKKKHLKIVDWPARAECFGHPYTPGRLTFECDACPDLDECCLEAARR